MAIVLLITLSASHTATCLVWHDLVGCQPSGYLPGRSGNCEMSNSPDCCVDGKQYLQFLCSPPVSATTWAVLTVNGFSKGKDGGLPSECDGAYHDDSEMVVALSTGWFSGMSRCGRSIKITAAKGGSSAYAKVVDECDSVHGCDAEHNYEEPCAYNVVDASPAVWDALGLDQSLGLQDVTWSDE
ncbi:putative ripening-related protein 5 [Hordeum vulgare]|uniref:putative ripening-related protein 5 n=1 Tax=Hordeum vulgare subsp. vulgare TaxID=112509 RepID=UPI001D1A4A5C|nr:putative ripening-related protein 5 [Hordeum vulgare subsp. vulgare]KAE8814052.1 putative ripening-related protein 5 [Hordeum vulgare]